MIELILTLLVSVVAGTVIGLLPGLPIWLGVFLIFPWLDLLSPAQIMMYWLGIAIGSQYFGSVSTLLLRVPGENSSLIYIKDTFDMDQQQRLDLVRQTAWGSAVATVISLCVVAILYSLGNGASMIEWTNSTVKFAVYSALIVLLIVTADHRRWAVMLLILGIVLADKTNQSLPTWILQINHDIAHITIFSAMIGLIVVPELIAYRTDESAQKERLSGYTPTPLQWWTMLRGTVIGCVSGLIPGMTATIGSISAYKFVPGTPTQRIIAAESANNSAIITALLPLLIIGIPITVDEIIVSNALTLKLLEMPAVFRETTVLGISLGWLTIGVGFVFAMVYFWLSQKFLPIYVKLVELLHTRLRWIYVIILGFLIYFDVTLNAVNILPYVILLLVITGLGIYLRRRSINPLPLLLGILLGDSMSWTTYHVISRYF
jgi:putative tricarboxylic transport membrane protein